MPEIRPWVEEHARRLDTFTRPLLQDCYRNGADTNLSKEQQLARRNGRYGDAAIGEEAMADDFRLLLDAVMLERLSGFQHVSIAAEGMPHQHQIEAAALLGLPDVGHLMDEIGLGGE